ncbi:MAG: PhoH family protein [Firmicutes bacterium]|nr:PhoH family protein [Bacillota bacterium]
MVDALSQILRLRDNEHAQAVSGKRDENLRLVESAFGVKIVPRGLELLISGSDEAVSKTTRALTNLASLGTDLTSHDVYYAIQLSQNGESTALEELSADVVVATHRGKLIRPKTSGQRRYIKSISRNDIVFGIGPAGTGKTYLAMAVAVASLKKKEVERLILTRPAVEAGEHLGFLPGDLQDKVDPYLRPLYDALYDILGQETYLKYREKGIIEIAPLAYMRGRTLDDSFIILDEAQNCTPEQMKMFLTRLGFGSKAVVTGDITQVDLPRGKTSGLIQIQKILKKVEGIGFSYLHESDVVRHPLVQRIIQAYDSYDKKS